MLELNEELFEYVLAPLVSAQLFITILLYFIVVRKRIAADYSLYNLFIITFIIFLIGRISWVYLDEVGAIIVLYIRMGLFMGIGIPSLLIAAAKQSGIKITTPLFVSPYILGVILAVAYILFYDAGTLNWFIRHDQLTFQPSNYVAMAHNIQVLGAIIQLIIPCSLLIVKELLGQKQLKLLLFLSGSLIFGITLAIGVSSKPQNIGLYYIGSIPTGIMWIWAVFLDINDMKGKVGLLKDELQFMLRSDVSRRSFEIKSLLNNLEELSQGNLDVYKMRIREILNRLTDTTIEAGGNTAQLVQRNVELAQVIDTSSDTHQIKEMVVKEAIELSEILTDIPSQNSIAIDKTIQYLNANYAENFSVDDIAAIAGLSKAHLMREFKKNTGQTINQYQTQIRIDEAKRLLAAKKTVGDTAYLVGYNNPNYFSTVFKKTEGQSPVEFQDSLGQNK